MHADAGLTAVTDKGQGFSQGDAECKLTTVADAHASYRPRSAADKLTPNASKQNMQNAAIAKDAEEVQAASYQ